MQKKNIYVGYEKVLKIDSKIETKKDRKNMLQKRKLVESYTNVEEMESKSRQLRDWRI